MTCTVDASVFVAAIRTQEKYHHSSREFLRRVQAGRTDVFCSALILAECGAAIARGTGDSVLAKELVRLVENLSILRLVALDAALARQAAQIDIANHLRGADAVYVAVAQASNATLVTRDTEMLRRCPSAVSTVTPEQWLSQT